MKQFAAFFVLVIAIATVQSCDYGLFDYDYTECRNGECLHGSEICDGVVTCDDGSDEDESYCRSLRCPSAWDDEWVKCADGLECFLDSQYCDGWQHCRDGSDEDQAYCEKWFW